MHKQMLISFLVGAALIAIWTLLTNPFSISQWHDVFLAFFLIPIIWAFHKYKDNEDVGTGLWSGLASGLWIGLVLGLDLGFGIGFGTGLFVGLIMGLAFGVAFGVAFGLIMGLIHGFVVGLAVGLAVGLVYYLVGVFPKHLKIFWKWLTTDKDNKKNEASDDCCGGEPPKA